jgi:hypothetical protein
LISAGGSMSSVLSSCSMGSGRRGRTWYSIGARWVWLHLAPDAGCSVAADHAVVQHGDAGAADHGVQLVAHHELGQRAPQRQDHAAVAVVGVHAAAAQLHHALAQAAQAGQVKLGVAVGAAHALGLGRA